MFEKVVTAPPEWFDSEGFLQQARYLDTCHLCVRQFFEKTGIGERYRYERGLAFFNLGINLDCVAEIAIGEPLRIAVRVVDLSAKVIHLFIEMFHAETGELKARHERLLVHIDIAGRRSTAFPADIAARLAEVVESDTRDFDMSRLGRRLADIPVPR